MIRATPLPSSGRVGDAICRGGANAMFGVVVVMALALTCAVRPGSARAAGFGNPPPQTDITGALGHLPPGGAVLHTGSGNTCIDWDNIWSQNTQRLCFVCARNKTIQYMDSTAYGGIPLFDRTDTDCKTPPVPPYPYPLSQLLPEQDADCSRNKTTVALLFHYMVAFTPQWCNDFWYSMDATNHTGITWLTSPQAPPRITRMSDYTAIYEFFRNHYGEGLKTYRKKPAGLWKPDDATDPRLELNNTWNEDKVFAELRLMGVNPLQLQRVTFSRTVGMHRDRLLAMLNTTLDLGAAINAALNTTAHTLDEIVRSNRLYVIHFPLLAKIVGDVNARGAYANKSMMAPIALFVATNITSYPLKPVAIQLGHTQSDRIYTPASGYFWWTVSKIYVNNADGLTSQIRHHLVNSHLISEVFAVAAFRYLGYFHPIHVLLRQHFDGLIGINSKGFDLLTNREGAVTEVAGFGFDGLNQFITVSYEDWTWNDTKVVTSSGGRELGQFEKRGMDDTTALPYYPYRDDGLKVYRILQDYVHEYVMRFYCSEPALLVDHRLQSWVQEISERHANKGFPSSLRSRDDLIDILVRIIWVNSAQHAALNYPVKEIGSFTPATTYTVFKAPEDWTHDEIASITGDDHNDQLVAMLPNAYIAAKQTAVATQLASLRFTNLLNYSQKLTDEYTRLASKTVKKYHRRLMRLDTELRATNVRRKRTGLKPYRNLLPTFLPNSIAI